MEGFSAKTSQPLKNKVIPIPPIIVDHRKIEKSLCFNFKHSVLREIPNTHGHMEQCHKNSCARL